MKLGADLAMALKLVEMLCTVQNWVHELAMSRNVHSFLSYVG